MSSVTGSEISSAVRSSRVTTSPIALSVVPGPAAWTVTSVCAPLELVDGGDHPVDVVRRVVGIAAQGDLDEARAALVDVPDQRGRP